MSLIERAVNRLQGTKGANPSAASVPGARPRSTDAARRKPRPAPAPDRRVEIDLAALASRGFITPDAADGMVAQEFRLIKRPLLANALGQGAIPIENGRMIMVTSALSGEGKTYCAINLAMSIAAELDTRTLLVDADVARPSVLRELGIARQPGLMDWLVDDRIDLSHLVLGTNVDKLDILPAGRKHQQATELLASGSMNRLLARIDELFPEHVVIFDSPPLLLTTESRVLASYMGQIVMVVSAGSTEQAAVMEALSTIESCEVIGMVLNKTRRTEKGYSGGYGVYGYGYGHEAE